MSLVFLDDFREIWLADFEFRCPPGERPDPRCLVAQEFRSGRTVRLWADQLAKEASPPWPTGPESLFVAFYASAELGCLLSLNWPMPERILDLYVEFRNLTNGRPLVSGSGLLGALLHYGLDAMEATEKETMQQLAMRDGPYSDAERSALLDYCETDVQALARLLPRMAPPLDLPRALLRGRYMAAAARMEWNGTPVDSLTLSRLRPNWNTIKARLVEAVDADFGVYAPTDRRALDRGTEFGAAVFALAEEHNLDPYRLADVAAQLWKEDRAATAEVRESVTAARKSTGLTPARIRRWEDAGNDSASWPGFDVQARSLATAYPALGIGAGFRLDTGYDDTDYTGRLWERLRDERTESRPKHDPEILQRAVEIVAHESHEAPLVPMSFSAARFAEWLIRNCIPWPRLESGALDLSDDVFRQMARSHPQVAPLAELRHTLSQLRLNELAVGGDGRNRCLLSAFRARTGRNQPSNSAFIFGPSCWLRALIAPAPGRAVAYVDWSQQEFGIAAALSGDRAMMEAYSSGDPYLTFAKQAGAVPANATKHSHSKERDQFKVCALAVKYGMGERSLAQAVGKPEAFARELLRLHRLTYPTFWRWSQAAVDHAMLRGWLHTVFGWRIHVGPDANPRSLANFPMQANGSEMLRLACCLLTERGIEVCAPVHDAVLVEGPADEIESVVEATQQAMREASLAVLPGFPLRSDAKIIRPGERYLDPRGVRMWETVLMLLDEIPVPGLIDEEFF